MFRDRLYETRKQKGLTLEELASKYNRMFPGSGLNKSTLSKYENGKQEPMLSTVRNLSILLNVSAEYLLEVDEKRMLMDDESYKVFEQIYVRNELMETCKLLITCNVEEANKILSIVRIIKDV